MDSRRYLKSYGWKEGEPLKVGGLKKPVLVKHKYDRKGIGNSVGNNDGEAWWERLFDGHLKNLDVNSASGGGITFNQKEATASAVSKSSSPLYRRFVRGEGLKGTIDLKDNSPVVVGDKQKERHRSSKTKISKKDRKHKSSKKEKKSRKEKKSKKRDKEKKVDT